MHSCIYLWSVFKVHAFHDMLLAVREQFTGVCSPPTNMVLWITYGSKHFYSLWSVPCFMADLHTRQAQLGPAWSKSDQPLILWEGKSGYR